VSTDGPIRILSIDGGGARGAIAAHLLHLLEQHAGVKVHDDFDFFAGVSTGALIAAYCAKGAGTMEFLAKKSYSAENLARVFDKSIWDNVLGRIQNQPKYDGTNKRAYIEELAEGARINDIVDKHLLILAYDFMNRELVAFKNNRGEHSAYNPTLAEICDAASAAPTLYPPVATSAPKRRWLIDGSLATNDPSLCAIAETLAMGHSLSDIWMISIGTGRPVHDLSQEDRDRIGTASRDWGVVGWLLNGLLDHMMVASSSVSAYQCQQLLGDRYLRVDGELPRKLLQLDNTDEIRIADLESYAFLWYEKHVARVREILDGAAAQARRRSR
jgi:patatin-like phospholipase/acyl hydrolase